MKRITKILVLIGIASLLAFSANKTENTKFKKIQGLLIHKPWSKNTDSYCAQGSDYFVIQTDSSSELVLEPKDSTIWNAMKEFESRKVLLSGNTRTKEIKPSNPNEQQIVTFDGGNYTCKVFTVETIELK
jgi:hypothetical protein